MVWALPAPRSRSEWLRVPLGSCPAPPKSFTRLCKQAAEPSPDSKAFRNLLGRKMCLSRGSRDGSTLGHVCVPVWDTVPAERHCALPALPCCPAETGMEELKENS